MSLRSDDTRWGGVAKAFHWLMAVLILGAGIAGLFMSGMPNSPQKINVYADFVQKSLETPESEHHYYGIALFGDKKKINRLTGMLPLLRA